MNQRNLAQALRDRKAGRCLLRGPERDDHVLYSSHTLWRSRGDFEAWTRSEAFRLAHRDAGSNRPLYLGHPEFEGFEVIQTVEPASAHR